MKRLNQSSPASIKAESSHGFRSCGPARPERPPFAEAPSATGSQRPSTDAVTISVVLPALNEAEVLPTTLSRAQDVPEIAEIIVVDGGSIDGTPDLAAALGCRVLTTRAGRGTQMRRGAAEAAGDVVLLLHADTWLPADAGKAIARCLQNPKVVGGGFWKQFRAAPWFMRGSRMRCAIRLWLGRRIAGDQGLFIRRRTLERIGGVPDMPLMEEFELCHRLRREGRLALAKATVSTSTRRFAQAGIARTYLRMWQVTWLYRLGFPAEQLFRIYNSEKEFGTNSRPTSVKSDTT